MALFSGAQTREQALSSHAELANLFASFHGQFFEQQAVPAQALELCRLRLAQLHRNGHEFARIDVVLGQQHRDNLARWPSEDLFTAGEKACLELAEVYCMDPHAITDALADSVKSHYGDAGLVALLQWLGVSDGLIRLSQVWQLPGARP